MAKIRYNGLILYPESQTDVLNQIKEMSDRQYSPLAYILHDKDVDENGVLKKPHWHVMTALPKTVIKSLWPNIMCQTLSSESGMYAYLTHENNPDKYHYPHEDISCNEAFADLYGKSMRASNETNISAIQDYVEKHHITDLCLLPANITALNPSYARDLCNSKRHYEKTMQALNAHEKDRGENATGILQEKMEQTFEAKYYDLQERHDNLMEELKKERNMYSGQISELAEQVTNMQETIRSLTLALQQANVSRETLKLKED